MVRRGLDASAWLAPLLVGAVAFVAARQAMLPGLGFWDTAELQAVAPVMGTAHPTGFPTYVLLGWLLNLILTPFGEPALRMNIFAGLSVAVAAAVTVDLTRALTRSTALGVLAGLGLALTPQVWAIGTHAEAHALHLALVAILFRLLVGWEARARAHDEPVGARRRADRWLVAAAVVFGLSLGNHSLTLLLAPPVGLYVLAVEPGILRRPRFVLTAAFALALTVVVVFLELPLRAGPFRAPLVYGRPDTWDGFWYVVLAEQFRGSLIDPLGDLGGKVGGLVVRAAAQFGPLALLLPVAFIATALLRPRYALLSGLAVLATVFFAASYANADIGRYYLVPILAAWTWLAILAEGLVRLATSGDDGSDPDPWRAGRIGRAAPRRPRARTWLALLLAIALLVPTAIAVPSRTAAVDESEDRSAQQWVDRALTVMEPDALIVSWWSFSTPLWYAQHVEGRRPDLAIIDDRTRLDQGLGDIYDVIDANLGRRPVYVIRDDPAEIRQLEARYILDPIDGPDARFLTRVVGAAPAS